MTDRDHFAAAALTGLLARGLLQSNLLAADAYKVADAMLRERCRRDGDCPGSDNAANHDAAPAARAPEPEPEPAARRRPAGGTGDTQEIAAFRRFVGQVMDWISEATSAYAPACSSDGGRKIMADACSRCWDAFDRIAYPTTPHSAPACDGVDVLSTPDSGGPINRAAHGGQPPTRSGESERRDVPQPDNGRAAGGPAHNTPPDNAPQAPDFAGKAPDFVTLTDAEREAIRTAADAYAVRGSADGRESVNAATLRGLLERLGGGR